MQIATTTMIGPSFLLKKEKLVGPKDANKASWLCSMLANASSICGILQTQRRLHDIAKRSFALKRFSARIKTKVRNMQIATTTMSVKGQVVIPKDLREEAGLKEADKLMVYATPGSVIIKKIDREAAKRELQDLFRTIDSKNLGLTPEDINREVHAYRREKRAEEQKIRRQ